MKTKPHYDPATGEYRVPLDPEGVTGLVSKDPVALEQELDRLAAMGRYAGPFDEEEAPLDSVP